MRRVLQRMRRRLGDEAGIGMILVIGIMVFVAGITATAGIVAMNGLGQSRQRDRLRAVPRGGRGRDRPDARPGAVGLRFRLRGLSDPGARHRAGRWVHRRTASSSRRRPRPRAGTRGRGQRPSSTRSRQPRGPAASRHAWSTHQRGTSSSSSRSTPKADATSSTGVSTRAAGHPGGEPTRPWSAPSRWSTSSCPTSPSTPC